MAKVVECLIHTEIHSCHSEDPHPKVSPCFAISLTNVGFAMEVYFLASGERLASLDAADFEGKTAKIVKQLLTTQLGVSRFRQKLFVEDGSREIPDDEVRRNVANNAFFSISASVSLSLFIYQYLSISISLSLFLYL